MLSAFAEAAGGPTLFRLFLTDGSTLVSFGEFARLDDRVIFSMPVGGPAEQPRLYVVSLPAFRVDWARTDEYSSTARAQWYADTRGEEEFQQLSSEVARVLNEIALIPDRRQGLEMAESARKVLAEWPRSHFGYRQADVREIVSLLDEAISDLRASLGVGTFDLALVVTPADEAALAPLLAAPSVREQVDQVFRVTAMTERSADRVGLLHAALALLRESGASLPETEARQWQRQAEAQIRLEGAIDASYADLSRKTMNSATRAAAAANIAGVQRLFNDLQKQDDRLGRARPETMDALRSSLEAHLDAARQLRLRRDQWVVRKGLYSEYQRSTGSQVRTLASLQSSLQAIRRLDGPPPGTLASLRKRLDGGADRLQRIGQGVPDDLREAHGLLVSAWRFAEKAVSARSDAVASGNLATAWEASSAAAGALLMFSRAQQDIGLLVEPPKLQ